MLARLVQSSFSIVFPRQTHIRRMANEFEDYLRGHYLQPQIIPVPDELDPEVPRIVFSSSHGYSQIIISQISIVITASYSPDWQIDRSKGENYFAERGALSFELLRLLGNVPASFCGISNRLQLTGYSDDRQTIAHLVRALGLRQADPDIFDLELKVTEVLDNRYFSNVSCKNFLGWNLGEMPGLSRLPRGQATERGIEVLCDFNDRYAYNEEPGYHSGVNDTKVMLQKGFTEVAKAIARFGGEEE